jgi:hypothetical protein
VTQARFHVGADLTAHKLSCSASASVITLLGIGLVSATRPPRVRRRIVVGRSGPAARFGGRVRVVQIRSGKRDPLPLRASLVAFGVWRHSLPLVDHRHDRRQDSGVGYARPWHRQTAINNSVDCARRRPRPMV